MAGNGRRPKLEDVQRGLYYAFPFLAGTRPFEQLALLWSDIDLEENTITIHRTQDSKGIVYDITKTEAGTRVIPIYRTVSAPCFCNTVSPASG